MGLRNLFNGKDKELVGLDISSGHVSMVQVCRKRGDYVVTGAASVGLDFDTEDCSNTKEIKLAKAMQRCRQEGKITARNAIFGVSGPDVAVRRFEFPPLPAEEVESAIMLEASQVCPFDISDAVVDYQLLDNGDKKTRGVLVAATNELIERKRRLAAEAAFNCVMIDADGLALLNCLSHYHKPDPESLIAVVEVGEYGAVIANLFKGCEPFVRDLNYPFKSLAEQISKERDISMDQARQLLRSNDCCDGTDLYSCAAVTEAVNKLVDDISSTIKYHASQTSVKSAKEIFICGELSHVFYKPLAANLEADVELWNPFNSIAHDDTEFESILKNKGSAMAVAAGLSMRRI